MIKVAIVGAAGRMGRALIEAVSASEGLVLVAATVRDQSSLLGQDAGIVAGVGELNVPICTVDDLNSAVFDVLIDFTHPELTLRLAALCQAKRSALIVGTTGFSDEERAVLQSFSHYIPLLIASNMSVGVNVAYKLLAMAAKAMHGDYDIEIIEAHHRYKKDSPSGTALSMGEAIAQAVDIDLKDHAIYGREGMIGERPEGEIGFSTVRGGDVVGDHTVMFLGDGDRLEITHKASSRMTFATGAVRAARWLATHNPGLYSMSDVLGLKD